MSKIKRIIIPFSFLIALFYVASFLYVSSANADFIDSWSSTSSLPNILANQSSIVFNNKIYELGGSNTEVVQTSLYSSIGTNGNITSWNSLSGESPNKFFQASAIKDNFVYLLGGATYPPSTIESSVYYGKIGQSGDITSWTSSSPVPYPAIKAEAIVVGNRLYFAGGGDNNGTIYSDINFATINSDGSLSAWQSAGTLPLPLESFSMLSDNNGDIIIVGGETTNNVTIPSVYKTSLKTDGTIATWQTLTPLPQSYNLGGAVLEGNTIFVVGGVVDDSGDPIIRSNKVFIGELDAQNNLGTWTESPNSLPLSACCGTLNYLNGYLYWVGGFDSSQGYVDDVYYAKVTNGNAKTDKLNVPYLNQTSSPWGLTEYDHAQSLGFVPYNMSRWGCAVTSATMVLKSYGMNALPDGTSLDPGSLNQWLNNNNGYLTGKDSSGNYSYLDWTKIGTLVHAAQLAGKSPTDVMVQVVRAPTQNSFSTIFASDYDQQIPDIVETNNASTSGHFVVTTGKTNSSYTINDPYWNTPTLASFNNNLDEVVRLIPSHTDLSYITIVVDPTVNIFVTDVNGKREGNNGSQTFNEISNAVYGIEKPIGSPTDKTTLGTGVNRLLLPLPTNGLYNIVLSSKTAQTFTVNISTIQADGTSQIKTISGAVGPQDSPTFTLNYSNTQSSTTTPTTVTIQSTINDVISLYQAKLINFAIDTALSATLKSALSDQKLHLVTAEKAILKADDAIILQQKNSGGISQSTYNVLHTDFLALE